MSNEKPLKLNMSFTEALQMIAIGGKPPSEVVKPKKAAKKPPKKKPSTKPAR